jgi:hypothetical protein
MRSGLTLTLTIVFVVYGSWNQRSACSMVPCRAPHCLRLAQTQHIPLEVFSRKLTGKEYTTLSLTWCALYANELKDPARCRCGGGCNVVFSALLYGAWNSAHALMDHGLLEQLCNSGGIRKSKCRICRKDESPIVPLFP